jgi:ribosomal protein S18 acetylase RimI-like enzyme
VFVRATVPEGWTSKDVDRWREHATKVFAEFAVKTLLAEQERAAAAAAASSGGVAREFRVTDHERVLALWKASEGIVLRDADKRPAIARYLRRNPKTSFVWEADGVLVGAVLAGHDGRRGFLHHLAVAPEHRRRGVGRALVEHALAALAKQSIEKCHIMVLPANAAARKFWKNLGWVERTDVVLLSRTVVGKPEA